MSFNSLEFKLESAAKSVVESYSGANYPVHTGVDPEELEANAIVLMVEESDGHDVVKGNFNCRLVVRIQSEANDTTREEHMETVGTVRDSLMVTDLAQRLNDAGEDLTVFGFQVGPVRHGIDGSTWNSEITLDIHCAPSTIS